MIDLVILLGATLGFIIGVLFYKQFGWKPKGELTENNKGFIAVSTSLFGFVGLIMGIFIALGIFVLFQ